MLYLRQGYAANADNVLILFGNNDFIAVNTQLNKQ